MLQYCSLGNHSFEDGIEYKSISQEEGLNTLRSHEILGCKECGDKLTKSAVEFIKKVNSGEIDIDERIKSLSESMNKILDEKK